MLMMNEVRAELFLRRLPQQVRASLTSEQEAALKAAAGARAADSHPVDLRFSLPTPWGRYYLALFGGRDRRSRARRQADRRHRPLLTASNALFASGVLGGICVLILLGLLFAGAVLEL
ncbi:MAG: hypothetical protein BroJett029_38190 [Alphaproteobacteria bacterium]|nr:MAG: hypothetical protein BroJett029_38190 [Alphaproteobacteria bacterium]